MRISDWSSAVCSSDLRPRGSTCGGCSKAGERHRGRCRRSRRTTLAACISAVFPLCARASVMVIPGGVAECATVSRRNDMSDQLMLTAETRERAGKGASRERRRKDRQRVGEGKSGAGGVGHGGCRSHQQKKERKKT